jgi:uncharacterized protein (UPF0332 family)
MNEIKSLIERAKRYLRSAENPQFQGRIMLCSISAQAILLTKNLSFSSHRGVISAFGKHFIKTGVLPREMGRELNRAFAKRQLGDYEYTFVISRAEAEQILGNGKDFVEKIAQHLRATEIL